MNFQYSSKIHSASTSPEKFPSYQNMELSIEEELQCVIQLKRLTTGSSYSLLHHFYPALASCNSLVLMSPHIHWGQIAMELLTIILYLNKSRPVIQLPLLHRTRKMGSHLLLEKLLRPSD